MIPGLSLPGRTTVGATVLAVLIGMIGLDLLQSAPIDPYQAPWPVALGSGQVPSGAHCTNVSALGDQAGTDGI